MRKFPPCYSTCIGGKISIKLHSTGSLHCCVRGVSLKKSITMLALLVLQLLVIPTLTLCAQHGSNLHGSISGLSLLAIQNNEDSGDVEIIIVSNNAKNLSEQQQSQIHIPGHSLSSGCGDHYFRCQGDNLLVETLFLEDGREFEVIFIPLDLTIPIIEQSKSTDLQLPLIIVGSIAALVIIINIIAITIYFLKRYRKTPQVKI